MYEVKDEDGKAVSILRRPLLPEGSARPQPDYIPQQIREDYAEACLIRELSPKASATLSRRCLQGMIRDFTGIKRDKLFKEIQALRDAVDADNAPKGVSSESVDAIDQVRTVGNIGAHMETDVDHIVPVEAEEAELLTDLIEMLFEEWYIERHKREDRLKAIAKLADEKKALRKAAPPQLTGPGKSTEPCGLCPEGK